MNEVFILKVFDFSIIFILELSVEFEGNFKNSRDGDKDDIVFLRDNEVFLVLWVVKVDRGNELEIENE